MSYTRDEVIHDIAAMIAGCQVPASLDGRVMLGTAYEPWQRLFSGLHTFGWTDAEQIEKELRVVLDEPKPERNIRLWLREDHWGWMRTGGSYSSVPSAKRAVRKWLAVYEEKGKSVVTYIQLPGEPDPTEDDGVTE